MEVFEPGLFRLCEYGYPPFVLKSSFAQGDDPDGFNPNRFIDENGKVSPAVAFWSTV